MDIDGKFSILLYEVDKNKISSNHNMDHKKIDSSELSEVMRAQVLRELNKGFDHVVIVVRLEKDGGKGMSFSVSGISLPGHIDFCLVSEIAAKVEGFDAEDINIFLCTHGYTQRDRNTGKSNTVYNYYPTEKAGGGWKRKNRTTVLWNRQFVLDLLDHWKENGKACFRTPAECAKIFGYSEEQFNAIMEIRGYQAVNNGKCYPSKRLKEGEGQDCYYTEYEDGKPIWNVFKIKTAMHRERTCGGYE